MKVTIQLDDGHISRWLKESYGEHDFKPNLELVLKSDSQLDYRFRVLKIEPE